jgi:hypothetical protein
MLPKDLLWYVLPAVVAYAIYYMVSERKLFHAIVLGTYDCYDSTSYTHDPNVMVNVPKPKRCPLFDKPFRTFQGVQLESPFPWTCCQNPYGSEIMLDFEDKADLIEHLEDEWDWCYKAFPETHPMWTLVYCSPKSTLVLYKKIIYYNFSGKDLLRREVEKVPCTKSREYMSYTACPYPYYTMEIGNFSQYKCWLGKHVFITTDNYCIAVDPDFQYRDYLY